MNEKPKFKHGCECCVFLGGYKGKAYEQEKKEMEFDLYFCKQGSGAIPTVLARYSDEPHEYASGMILTECLPLVEAKKRAIEKGLIKQKE